ncbi:agip102 [Agrotis ipsilon multiple nucleopolyhedrovirus]|uniref:RrmJ-type SAM-dependent 2'-O-MTase domain-containing protein n=1 Tax=Agrotis ipsilon multiple nucleopolyhedrovirus TaxID=208013 RepID=B6D616_9ABAC|nr:agip102 [Agrotis ipsilon multiple nucleopolyhedrovirus]ACI28803.1 unknown [Agrotis ipsilon multiple nucleopolyhedrovirus]
MTTPSPFRDNLKKDLDELKNQLNRYDPRDVRRARDRLDRRRRVRDRCYFKIKEIDDKFTVCRNINVFLDLCGGPGQFAKYVFNVNDDDCLGFGVTLRNHCDYNFSHPNFRKMYGCFDTGDIFDANVLFELMYFCRHKCDLVLADGAFDVAGRENDQETLSLSLIRKECSVILEALRVGGSCVVKIFDTFNNSTISLLRNFVGHFEQHHLYKPPHSRAANSEKYLVCKGKLASSVDATTTTTTTPENVFNAQTRKFARRQRRALKRLLAILENGARLDENYGNRPGSAGVL